MTEQTALPEDHIDAAKVALQNDQFRRWHCLGERKPGIYIPGKSVWTRGIAALEKDLLRRVLQAIGTFSDFTPANDPDAYHDFGSIEIDGQDYWFKIDMYDTGYDWGFEDPSDLEQTRRVLTILLPSEW